MNKLEFYNTRCNHYIPNTLYPSKMLFFVLKIHIVLCRHFNIQNEKLQYICSKTHKCNKNVCADMTWFERMWYKTNILHHHISQDNFLQGPYFPKPNIWLPLLSQHFEILCIKYCSIGNVFASPFRLETKHSFFTILDMGNIWHIKTDWISLICKI